jgi:hypothetical protein
MFGEKKKTKSTDSQIRRRSRKACLRTTTMTRGQQVYTSRMIARTVRVL